MNIDKVFMSYSVYVCVYTYTHEYIFRKWDKGKVAQMKSQLG